MHAIERATRRDLCLLAGNFVCSKCTLFHDSMAGIMFLMALAQSDFPPIT